MLKDRISAIKDALVGLREAILIGLLLVVLAFPPLVTDWLRDSKLAKVGVFGLTLEQAREASSDAVATANQLAELKRRAEESSQTFTKLVESINASRLPQGGDTAGAAIDANVRALAVNLGTTVKLATSATVRNAQTVAAQSKTVEELGGRPTALRGWAVAGRVTRDGAQWLPRTRIVNTGDPTRLVGATAVFNTAAPLHSLQPAADAPTYYSRRAVIGAIAEDESVVVEARALSPSRDGNAFLWLLIAKR